MAAFRDWALAEGHGNTTWIIERQEARRLFEQFDVLLKATQEVETMAFRQYVDWMHFHELAMAKPFDAESEAQDFARRVSSLLTIALGDNTTIETVDISNPASGNMGGVLHQEQSDHLRRAAESSPASVSERATGIPGRATAPPMSAGGTAEGQVSATVTRSETPDPASRAEA